MRCENANDTAMAQGGEGVHTGDIVWDLDETLEGCADKSEEMMFNR